MKKFLLICFLILSSYQFAQENFDGKIDSLRLQNKYNVMLNPDLKLIMMIDNYNSYSNNIFSGQTSALSQMELNRIKININKSLIIYRAGQNKYHLGVVSDVLGYVGTAAAAGFAAYHIYKYRKEYGIK